MKWPTFVTSYSYAVRDGLRAVKNAIEDLLIITKTLAVNSGLDQWYRSPSHSLGLNLAPPVPGVDPTSPLVEDGKTDNLQAPLLRDLQQEQKRKVVQDLELVVLSHLLS